MKKILFLVLIAACSSATKTSDWDNGANRRSMQMEEQRQEQVDNTNMQLTTPGRSGASQNQPFF